ncbi:MAG: tRNA pseudouridine(55) synthase TruB [Fretibacterium sp.]|nr:tRNA pseudouridine(55) synthase TruB [Fretibacterium sp.]
MPSGLLLIDKPEGLRSTECVGRVRSALRRRVKVGHAGTLDSTASGLLILLLGSVTRLSDRVMDLPKLYRARIRFGLSTDTCDYAGVPIFQGDPSQVDEATLDRALYSFLGARLQLPPAFSALKVGGRPAHSLARAGKKVVLGRRIVHITSLKRITPIRNDEVTLEIMCGRGTYIRSLAQDIGDLLGCGAHLAALRRLSIGPFSVSCAVAPEPEAFLSAPPVDPREAVSSFQRICLTKEAQGRLLQGLPVPLSEAGRYVPGEQELAKGLCVEGSNMIGFVDFFESSGRTFLKPRANIRFRAEDGL